MYNKDKILNSEGTSTKLKKIMVICKSTHRVLYTVTCNEILRDGLRGIALTLFITLSNIWQHLVERFKRRCAPPPPKKKETTKDWPTGRKFDTYRNLLCWVCLKISQIQFKLNSCEIQAGFSLYAENIQDNKSMKGTEKVNIEFLISQYDDDTTIITSMDQKSLLSP